MHLIYLQDAKIYFSVDVLHFSILRVQCFKIKINPDSYINIKEYLL